MSLNKKMMMMRIVALVFVVTANNLVDGAFLCNTQSQLFPQQQQQQHQQEIHERTGTFGSTSNNYSATKKRTNQQQRHKQQTSDNNRSILDDDQGHINRELADRIWQWEQQHRLNAQMPKMPYSSRSGIRLVKEVVFQIAQELKEQEKTNQKNEEKLADSIESDLIQEGMIALMDAMNFYRQFSQEEEGDTTGFGSGTFEEYARSYIQQRVLDSLERDYYPGSLPLALTKYQSILTQVRRLRPVMRKELGGTRDPTLSELAARIGIPTETLELYLTNSAKQAKQNKQADPSSGSSSASSSTDAVDVGTPLSMESTVEISNPLLDDTSPQFSDQKEWEHQEGHLLQEYRPTKAGVGNRQSRGFPGVVNKEDNEENVDDYIDEMLQHEGDDEMWVYNNQVVAPLKDIIPDTEQPSPDDIALSEMFKHDIDQLLTSTLNFEEIAVVRLRFGLDSYKVMSQTEIGRRFNISATKVHTILMTALDKLRSSYDDRSDMSVDDIEAYLDDHNKLYDDDVKVHLEDNNNM